MTGVVEGDEHAKLDQRIKASAAIEQCQIVEDVEVNGVVAGATVQDVNAGSAIDGVIAACAVDGVIAAVADEHIGKVVAGNSIAAGTTSGIFDIDIIGNCQVLGHAIDVRIGACGQVER